MADPANVSKSGIDKIVSFADEKIALHNQKEPDYDWKPSIEPPEDNFRKMAICEPPEFDRPTETVEISRQILRAGILSYLENEMPDNMLLVRTPPGTGKTTIAVEIAEKYARSGAKVGYLGPRHDLFADIVAKSSDPRMWYEWLPRQVEDKDAGKTQTCNYVDQMNKWLQRGYRAMDFCLGVCGSKFIKKDCVYHAQKNKKFPIVYIQHQHFTLGHPIPFDILIGDENPIGAFLREWSIPPRWIAPPGMDVSEPITEILHLMTYYTARLQKPAMGKALLDLLGGAQYVLDACDSFELPAEQIKAAMWIRRAEEVEEKPYFHLFNLVPLLAREARLAIKGPDYPHRIFLSSDGLTMLLRHKPDYSRIPPRVVWLDATGRKEIYKEIFGREVKVINAHPRMFGKIYQVINRANGKGSIIEPKTGKLTPKAAQAKALIEKIIEKNKYERPTIISFKGLVEQIDFPETVGISHFNAARGTNVHENASAIINLGTPQPKIFDLIKFAKMIFFERDTKFIPTWTTKERVYNYVDAKGRGRAYPVSGFWHDPDLQALLETMREDEIFQSAHRGRPVNRYVDIWLITNIPISILPPDELITMREIMDAPLGVNIFTYDSALQMAREIEAENGIVLIQDLLERGISKPTASKYFDALIESGEWTLVEGLIQSGRGRPPRAIKVKSRTLREDD